MPTGTGPIPKPSRRRLPYADRYAANAALAIPKAGMRRRDESVLDWARGRGTCELCGRPAKTEPLHVKTRGSGGPDAMANVVAGCRPCHNRTQDAGRTGQAELLAAIARRPRPPCPTSPST